MSGHRSTATPANEHRHTVKQSSRVFGGQGHTLTAPAHWTATAIGLGHYTPATPAEKILQMGSNESRSLGEAGHTLTALAHHTETAGEPGHHTAAAEPNQQPPATSSCRASPAHIHGRVKSSACSKIELIENPR